jgi:hypothetical protein
VRTSGSSEMNIRLRRHLLTSLWSFLLSWTFLAIADPSLLYYLAIIFQYVSLNTVDSE